MIEEENSQTEEAQWYDESPWEDVKNHLDNKWSEWEKSDGNIDRIDEYISEITEEPLIHTLTFQLVGYRIREALEYSKPITDTSLKKLVFQERLQAEAPIQLLQALSIDKELSEDSFLELQKKDNEIKKIKYNIKNSVDLERALLKIHGASYVENSINLKNFDKKSLKLLNKTGIVLLMSSVLLNHTGRQIVRAENIYDTRDKNPAISLPLGIEKGSRKLENSANIYATSYYNYIEENVRDPNIIRNMEYAMNLVNEYMKSNSIQPINIEENENLHEFMQRISEDPSLWVGKSFRYLDAMNYFIDRDQWLQPRQGIVGGGACDIATLIKRSITQNFIQIGETEYWSGHKVERWGPFVIVFREHNHYPGMAKDMIAVSSVSGERELKSYSNTSFIVFLVSDDKTNSAGEVRIEIEKKGDKFVATLKSYTEFEKSTHNDYYNSLNRTPC